MQQPRNFGSIEAFIEHLKSIPQVLGIFQYGSRDYRNMELGGDYDLTIIIDKSLGQHIIGLHFHIQDIPVDCGIIALKDLASSDPPSDYHCTLTKSQLLSDSTGSLRDKLQSVYRAAYHR